jgi:hypothetical protein
MSGDRAVHRIVLAILLCATAAGAATAQTGPPPDVSDVRREYAERVTAPMAQLLAIPTDQYASRTGGVDVLVTVERNADYAYLVFVPELDGEFPLYSAGTYILRRRRSDGQLDQLKVFLRSDPRFFVRIWPDGTERSTMSVFLADSAINLSIPVPYPIERILVEPLDLLMRSTQARVDWNLFFPPVDRPEYRVVAEMAATARSMLHTLPDAEDGAMDENGNLVLIDSLVLQDQQPGFNCSGFAKWIVDGLFAGLYGRFLPIEPLKEKHLDIRGNEWSEPLEEERDPYFGLDWTRNLATAFLSAQEGDIEVDPEAADVREVPFTPYIEDVGYPVEKLEQVVYLLALEEPGYLYLASINQEFGGEPALRQHVHIAVIFPYFDMLGQFHADVMERNVESSVESLIRRYGDDAVHLVRVRADESFAPPLIRN